MEASVIPVERASVVALILVQCPMTRHIWNTNDSP